MSDIAANGDIPEVTLGWRLRMAMERAQLKAEDMAADLGVHRGTITRWTHDIGSPPRPIYVERWASLCGVSYDWLAGDDINQLARSAPARISGNSSRTRTGSSRGCLSSTRRQRALPAVDCGSAVAA